MNFLVGTLYSGEREITRNFRSLADQRNHTVRQVLIENFSHQEAHQKLYETFMEQSDWADFFVKLDADMVLRKSDCLESILNRYQELPSIRDLEIAVDDFYTNRLIWGFHVYRPDVIWDFDDTLFVDRRPVDSDEHYYDSESLAGIVNHSPNPYPDQALMHGLKRGVKVLEITNTDSSQLSYLVTKILEHGLGNPFSESKPKDSGNVISDHWTAQRFVHERFRVTNDRRIGLSSLGFELGLTGTFAPEALNYSSKIFRRLMDRYGLLNSEELMEKLCETRSKNYGFLPSGFRRKVLRFLYQTGIRG